MSGARSGERREGVPARRRDVMCRPAGGMRCAGRLRAVAMRNPPLTLLCSPLPPTERTRRLLFRGAQAYMEGAVAAARPAEPGPAGEAHGEAPRWSGQLLIGHDGKLRRRPADRGECAGRVTEPRRNALS